MRQNTITPTIYNRSLSSLRVLAILVIVTVHFYQPDIDYLGYTAVSLCFVCSGYLTALHHSFETYNLKEHMRFFGRRVARLYPIHVLAIVLCVITMHHTLYWKTVISHMSMLQSFIPQACYYFGYNPVSWFVSTIIFLFFMAPWLIRGLRMLSVTWQWMLLVTLLVLQFWGGYTEVLHSYHLYQFPPMRLLDFAMGIAIYNLSQTTSFRQAQSRLNPPKATVLEVGTVLFFVIFQIVAEQYLYPHCKRALCNSALPVFIILTAMIFTHRCNGIVSKVLQWRPMAWLDNMGMEIFLLQLAVFQLLCILFSDAITGWPLWSKVTAHMGALLLASWLTKRFVETPIYKYYIQKIEPKLIGAKAA